MTENAASNAIAGYPHPSFAEALRAAISRAWTHQENEYKSFDADLVDAICEEVGKLFAAANERAEKAELERDAVIKRMNKSCDEGRGDPEYPICSRAYDAEHSVDSWRERAEAAELRAEDNARDAEHWRNFLKECEKARQVFEGAEKINSAITTFDAARSEEAK